MGVRRAARKGLGPHVPRRPPPRPLSAKGTDRGGSFSAPSRRERELVWVSDISHTLGHLFFPIEAAFGRQTRKNLLYDGVCR